MTLLLVFDEVEEGMALHLTETGERHSFSLSKWRKFMICKITWLLFIML